MDRTPFEPKVWRLAHGRHIELGPKAVIVGILNVTPDSFSDGGLFISFDKAIASAPHDRRGRGDHRCRRRVDQAGGGITAEEEQAQGASGHRGAGQGWRRADLDRHLP